MMISSKWMGTLNGFFFLLCAAQFVRAAAEYEEVGICVAYTPGQVLNLAFLSEFGSDASEVEGQVQDGLLEANEEAKMIVDELQEIRGDNIIVQTYNEYDNIGDIVNNVDLEDPEGFAMTYFTSMAPIVAPGVFLFVLSCICCPCFFLARCCCSHRCCKPRKEVGEYSLCQVYFPLLIFLSFSFASVGFAFLAIANVSAIVDATVAIFCEVGSFFESILNFFAEFEARFDGILSALMSLGNAIFYIFRNAFAVSSSVTDVQQELGSLSLYLVDLDSKLPDGYKSTEISDLILQVNDISATITSDVLPLFDHVTDTENSINLTFTDVFNFAKDLKNSSNGLTDIVKDIQNVSSEIEEVGVAANGGVDSAALPVFLFYSTVFLSFIVGVLATLTYLTPCRCDDALASKLLTISWTLTYLFMMFLFLMFTLSFPYAIIFSDICAVFLIIPEDWDKFFGFFNTSTIDNNAYDYEYALAFRSLQDEESDSFDAVDILDGCFATPSIGIFQSMNITNTTFVGLFDDVGSLINASEIEASLNLLDLGDIQTVSDGLSIASFGISSSTKSDALEALNSFTAANGNSIPYIESDCTITESCDRDCLAVTTCASTTSNPTASSTDLTALRTATIDAIYGFLLAEDAVIYISNSLDALIVFVDATRSNVNETLIGLETVVDRIEDTLDAIVLFFDAGGCGFIADFYYAMQSHICQDLLVAILMYSLYNFFIGLCSIPVILASVSMKVRMFGTGASKKAATVFTE